jgi:hypothetical protein
VGGRATLTGASHRLDQAGGEDAEGGALGGRVRQEPWDGLAKDLRLEAEQRALRSMQRRGS